MKDDFNTDLSKPCQSTNQKKFRELPHARTEVPIGQVVNGYILRKSSTNANAYSSWELGLND